MGFWTGEPGRIEQVSTLRPDQERLSKQLIKAGQKKGGGGAFGDSADYYRDLLSNNSKDVAAFSAPALRQYNEDIVPGISEQFAGMGSGGLSSSGFRNAQVQGATDLSERLGAIRANLRMQGAQGLQNIGQLGLQNFQENYQIPGTEGFLQAGAKGFGQGLAQYGVDALTGGLGSMTNWLKGTKTSASPNIESFNGLGSGPNIQNMNFGGR